MRYIYVILFVLFLPIIAFAHPGDTDSYGCHTCYTNCGSWGLDYEEYHCHSQSTLLTCIIPSPYDDCTNEELQQKLGQAGALASAVGILTTMYPAQSEEIRLICERKHNSYIYSVNAYNQCLKDRQAQIEENFRLDQEIKQRHYETQQAREYMVPVKPQSIPEPTPEIAVDYNELCNDLFSQNSLAVGNKCFCKEGFKIENSKCVAISSISVTELTTITATKPKDTTIKKSNKIVNIDELLPKINTSSAIKTATEQTTATQVNIVKEQPKLEIKFFQKITNSIYHFFIIIKLKFW